MLGRFGRLFAMTVACVALWGPALAVGAPVLEIESDGAAINNSLATAHAIGVESFTLPVPATVFDPPGFPTASISGAGGSIDVDFYSFSGSGQISLDVDNSPFTFNTIVSLFDSAGTLLAFNNDSAPVDPGSASSNDAFLGVYTLPGPATYYLALTTFNNAPITAGCGPPVALTRPDGAPGGEARADCTPGLGASFAFNGAQPDGAQLAFAYALHVSLETPGLAPPPLQIPAPAALGLVLAGAAVLAAVRGRSARHS